MHRRLKQAGACFRAQPRRGRVLAAAAAGALASLPVTARAQEAQAGVRGQQALERFERQLEQLQRENRVRVDPGVPAGDRVLIDYGGFASGYFLAIDDPSQETHVLRQYDLVGYARLNLDGAHELLARGRTTYRDFNAGDAFSRHGDDWVEPTLDRAHYRFDLKRALGAYAGKDVEYNLVFQGGRQLVTWANGLTLSEEIDGATVALSYEPFTLEVVAGVTRPSITDFDSSRPGFVGDTHRGFYGGMLSAQLGSHRPFVYALAQRDYNDSDTLVTGDVTTRFEYNSYYLGAGATGSFTDNLLSGVEAVFEGGEGLSNSFDPATFTQVEQTEDTIQAFALDARLDYLLNDPRRTRFSAEMILATGDSDRQATSNTFGGNRPGTKDHAFNAFGLLNTGLAFSPNVSNLLLGRVGVSTFPVPDVAPFKRLQVGLDVFVFNKLRAEAPIDETTGEHHYLGSEADLFLNWPITSDVTLTLRYGVFFPGEAIETDHDERHFFIAGLTYAF